MKEHLYFFLGMILFILKGIFWKIYWNGKLAQFHIQAGLKRKQLTRDTVRFVKNFPAAILGWIVLQGLKRGILPKEQMVKLLIAGLVILILVALVNSEKNKRLTN